MNDIPALPAETQYEYSIIGALCIEPRCIEKIHGKITKEDFSISACAAVYDAAASSYLNGKPFDCVIAANVLTDLMDGEAAERFIRDCMDVTPTVANVGYHAEALHKQAGARALRERLSEILYEGDPNNIATQAIEACRSFLESNIPTRMKTIFDALEQMYTSTERETLRVDTGFPKLDRLLKGMIGGNLVLLGARPGVGKTAMALNIATAVARKGQKVLIYSMEMLADEIVERIISQNGVSMNDLIDLKNAPKQTWGRITDIAQRISGLPILINDDPGTTPNKIREQAHAIDGLSLIIVDFLTLMRSDRRCESRNLEVGAISRDLKLLAAELRIPILALSQLNRGKEESDMPSIRDLRDSGELEQNANKVIFMWNVDKSRGRVGVYVAKNRRGRTGTVMMEFNGEYMQFVELLDEVPAKKKRRRAYDEDDDEA